MRGSATPLLIAPLAALAFSAGADEVTITSNRDNTLYEDLQGLLSNGAGSRMFAGVAGNGLIRRGLVRFNVAGAVPTGSTIDSVTLTLNVVMSPSPLPELTSLHRVTSDWGEGDSVAPMGQGIGALADFDDATWVYTFWPSATWGSIGGDFVASGSASADVAGNGAYQWSSAQMAADVQAWLDSPGGNYGWAIIGNESANATARAFATREGSAGDRPQLRIVFTPPGTSCYPDCDTSSGPGVLDIFDFLCFQDAFVQGDPYACDCDTASGPAVCDIFDFLCFQDAFVLGCP